MSEIIVYQREDNNFDWRLIADNGEQVCESSQGYTQPGDAVRGFLVVQEIICDGKPVLRYELEDGDARQAGEGLEGVSRTAQEGHAEEQSSPHREQQEAPE